METITRAHRGDLVIVPTRSSYVSRDEGYVESTRYLVGIVTSITRDGLVKTADEGFGCNIGHASSHVAECLIQEAGTMDMASVRAYLETVKPWERAFTSLEAVKAWARPFKLETEPAPTPGAPLAAPTFSETTAEDMAAWRTAIHAPLAAPTVTMSPECCINAHARCEHSWQGIPCACLCHLPPMAGGAPTPADDPAGPGATAEAELLADAIDDCATDQAGYWRITLEMAQQRADEDIANGATNGPAVQRLAQLQNAARRQLRPAPHTHFCPTCHQARPCTGTGCADGPRECATCSNCRGW